MVSSESSIPDTVGGIARAAAHPTLPRPRLRSAATGPSAQDPPTPPRPTLPMLRLAAAGAVGMYQRHISPHKGFCCAYRVHTGRVSCSEFGRRVIMRLGLVAFFRLMPRQFARCRAAFASLTLRHAHGDDESRGGRIRGALDSCDCADCGLSACDLGSSVDGCAVPCDCSF